MLPPIYIAQIIRTELDLLSWKTKSSSMEVARVTQLSLCLLEPLLKMRVRATASAASFLDYVSSHDYFQRSSCVSNVNCLRLAMLNISDPLYFLGFQIRLA